MQIKPWIQKKNENIVMDRFDILLEKSLSHRAPFVASTRGNKHGRWQKKEAGHVLSNGNDISVANLTGRPYSSAVYKYTIRCTAFIT